MRQASSKPFMNLLLNLIISSLSTSAIDSLIIRSTKLAGSSSLSSQLPPKSLPSTAMSESPVSSPWSPTSPQSPPYTPTSPDPPRSPAWTEYTLRSPASPAPQPVSAPFVSPVITPIGPRSPTSPVHEASSPQFPVLPNAVVHGHIKRHPHRPRPRAPQPKQPAKKLNRAGYDQKTFKPLNLKTLQAKGYKARDRRRLNIEMEIPPTTYSDAYGKTQTQQVGRREKTYTRWLPADGDGFMFGEEEKQRAIEKEKKWRDDNGWEELGKQQAKGKGREVNIDTLETPAISSTTTKRKFDTINDLPDYETADKLSARIAPDADNPPPAKKVLRDFKSSCMDGRTIRVYQESNGDLNSTRSFSEKYPGLTYDTIVHCKSSIQDTKMADSDDGEKDDINETNAKEATENVVPSAPNAVAAMVPQLVASAPISSPLTDDFTIHTTYTTLMTKHTAEDSADKLAFTPSDLALAETLLPHLSKHQRKKLRKRLGIKPPTDTNRQRVRVSTADGSHGGIPKGGRPCRGVPEQPRGPKKERQFDCRDGVLGNCPPDCAGRLHRENGKVEQRGKAKAKGVLLFGQGVEVGQFHSNEVAGRARGVEGKGRKNRSRKEKEKGQDKGKGKEREESLGESREEWALRVSS